MRGEVAVHPVRLDERHRGGDSAEELFVDRGGLGGDRCGGAVSVGGNELMETLRGRQVRGQVRIGLEVRAPLGLYGFRRIQVLDEELLDIAEIEVFEGR